ncbi:hypothetical protein EVU91_07375 [Macrococcoides bohemicum]|nr:hypothetical protein BHM04_05445 [Macrococcus sp. IME1552]TDL36908.1 hypothetical protein EVU91_07375 [Macrococcus bohemicus]
MGFYYLVLLIIGLVILTIGLKHKNSINLKIVMITFGIIFVLSSLVLFLPGSSEIISILIKN